VRVRAALRGGSFISPASGDAPTTTTTLTMTVRP
jgi:hypothetical protein